jgi:hypothetical protein
MSDDRTAAWYRFIPGVLDDLARSPSDVFVSVVNHRNVPNRQISPGLSAAIPENACRLLVTPERLESSWRELCLLDVPEEYDAIVYNPITLGKPVIEQYAECHCVDDILLGFGLAIRMGILSEKLATRCLLSPILILNLIVKNEIFFKIMGPVWDFIERYFNSMYEPKHGYHERAVNFVVERICSAIYWRELSRKGVKIGTVKYHCIDRNLVYSPGR